MSYLTPQQMCCLPRISQFFEKTLKTNERIWAPLCRQLCPLSYIKHCPAPSLSNSHAFLVQRFKPYMKNGITGSVAWKARVKIYTATLLDNQRLVVGCKDLTLKVYNLVTHKLLHNMKGHKGFIRALATLNERYVVSASTDQTLKVWDALKGSLFKTLTGHILDVSAVTTFKGGYAVSASWDGTLKVWNALEGTCLKTLSGHCGYVTAVTPLNEHSVVSAATDKTLRLWNIFEGPSQMESRLLKKDFPATILALTVLNQRYIVCGYGMCIHIWDIIKDEELRVFENPGGIIRALSVLNERCIVSASNDNTLRVLDLFSGEQVNVSTQHSNSIKAIQVLNEQTILTCSKDKTVRILKAANIDKSKQPLS